MLIPSLLTANFIASTETALLYVKNDILMNMNQPHVTLLEVINLSATFDTVDHSILLNRLQSNFDISGQAISCFKSYLHDRYQSISVNRSDLQEIWSKVRRSAGFLPCPPAFICYVQYVSYVCQQAIRHSGKQPPKCPCLHWWHEALCVI